MTSKSMSLSTLKFKNPRVVDTRSSLAAVTTMKGGTSFDGNPNDYYEWAFRVELKQMRLEAILKKDEDPEDKVSKIIDDVVDHLKGDALQVAIDLGVKDLAKPGGLQKLMDAIKAIVFPVRKLEAKELYNQGHKPGGVLTRQAGESMLSYISRRRRWWRLLQEMDPSIQLSNEIRGDLLLDHSGLSQYEPISAIDRTRERSKSN